MGRPGFHIPMQFSARAPASRLSFSPTAAGPIWFAARLVTGFATLAAAAFEVVPAPGVAGLRLHFALAGFAIGFAVLLMVPAIRRQRWCRAVLTDMWQGICLYDADGHLLLYNAQFCTVLGLSPADVRRAISRRDIIRLTVAAGHHDGSCMERICGDDAAVIALRQPALAYLQLPDGRLIAEAHQPGAGGGWTRTYADVTGRRLAEARVIHMARHDALTDLPNRTLFHERLEDALNGSGEPAAFAVLLLDLDRFKAVNDMLGHATGDLLLREVAARLRRAVRHGDTVARLGGDEFGVIQLGIDHPAQMDQAAKRLISLVSEPYDIAGNPSVGASVGIAVAPAHGTTAEALLKHADMALYHVKSTGRGAYCFFAAEMNADVTRRRQLEADLREALRRGEFELHYQPLINLRTLHVESFEALLRWSHPVRGMILPGEFIAVAEEIGLIVDIGAWVLREACRTATEWPAQITVAVNVSPAQFRGEQLVAAALEALTLGGLASCRLEIEVTESIMLQENAATLAVLHRLDELGVCIIMDDFGTGYASLGSLNRFPFQKIKIDRSFTRDVVSRPASLAIVRSIAQLGRSLGMKVTAEGIETPEQLARIVGEGCCSGQGYLFGRPMPRLAIPDYLSSWQAVGATHAALQLPQPVPH